MNNFDQKTTQFKALEVVNKLRINHLDKINLIHLINIYSWLSSEDILIDATFKDVIKLFLESSGLVCDLETQALLDGLE